MPSGYYVTFPVRNLLILFSLSLLCPSPFHFLYLFLYVVHTHTHTHTATEVELGDRLLPCFNSSSGIPFSDVNLLTGEAHAPEWSPDSTVSEVSTIQLEFRDLTRVTNNTKYQVISAGSLLHTCTHWSA